MDPYKNFLEACHTRYYETISFFHWKDCLFFRFLCFQQPVRCYRNYLSTSQVNARIPVPPHNFSPDVFFIRQNYKKNRPLSFLHWRACLFLLEILCLQQHFRSWRKNFVFCKMIVKTTCGLLEVVAWCLSYSIKREKLVNWFFSLEWLPFFQKVVFSKTSKVLQKWSYNFHSNCQINFLTLEKCSQKFVALDKSRKIGQNFSSLESLVFSPKNYISKSS